MDLLEIPQLEEFEYVLKNQYVVIRPCPGLSLTGVTIISLMEKLIWLQNLNSHGLIFFDSFVQKIKQTTGQNFFIISEWIQKIGQKIANLEEFQETIISPDFLSELNSLCLNFGLESTQFISENNIDLSYLSKELNIVYWLYDVKSHFEIKNNPFDTPILLTFMQIEKPDGLELSILYHENQGLDVIPEILEPPYAILYEGQANDLENCNESQTLKSFIKKTISFMQDNATLSEESCERVTGELKMLKSCMKRKWEFEDDIKRLTEKSKKNSEINRKSGQNVPLKEMPNPDFNRPVEKAPKKIEVEEEKNKINSKTTVVEPTKKEAPNISLYKPESGERSEFIEPIKEPPVYEPRPQSTIVSRESAPNYETCSFCHSDSALNALSLACNCPLCINCLRSGASFSRCPSCQRELSDSELDSIFVFIDTTFS